MSSRGEFRRAVDAALGAELPHHGDALQSWLAPTEETHIERIALEEIGEPDWRQPVDTTDPAYRALKASVRASGILQPLLVRRLPDGALQVISGLRRLRAARDTGQDTVPATVRELTEVQAIVGSWDAVLRERATVETHALIERRLTEGGMPAEEVARLLGSLQLVEGPATPSRVEAVAEPVVEPKPPKASYEAMPKAAPEVVDAPTPEIVDAPTPEIVDAPASGELEARAAPPSAAAKPPAAEAELATAVPAEPAAPVNEPEPRAVAITEFQAPVEEPEPRAAAAGQPAPPVEDPAPGIAESKEVALGEPEAPPEASPKAPQGVDAGASSPPPRAFAPRTPVEWRSPPATAAEPPPSAETGSPPQAQSPPASSPWPRVPAPRARRDLLSTEVPVAKLETPPEETVPTPPPPAEITEEPAPALPVVPEVNAAMAGTAEAPRPAEAPPPTDAPRPAEAPPPAETPPPAPPPKVISIALPRPTAQVDAGPAEPVVVAPRAGQATRSHTQEPVRAGAPSPAREGAVAASAAFLETARDWRTGATVGTFLFVLCVVYVIVIYLLGSTTLLAPALVIALIGAAVAVLSMARSRRAP